MQTRINVSSNSTFTYLLYCVYMCVLLFPFLSNTPFMYHFRFRPLRNHSHFACCNYSIGSETYYRWFRLNTHFMHYIRKGHNIHRICLYRGREMRLHSFFVGYITRHDDEWAACAICCCAAQSKDKQHKSNLCHPQRCVSHHIWPIAWWRWWWWWCRWNVKPKGIM